MTTAKTLRDIAALIRPTYPLCASELVRIADEVDVLEKENADHVCALPDSVNDAMNSGDGAYRP